jgi:hypothetical protein
MKTSSLRKKSEPRNIVSGNVDIKKISSAKRSAANVKIDTERSNERRSFLKLLSCSALGAAGVAVGIGSIERAEATQLEPLWHAAKILVGNSLADQPPSTFIECPLFFENGQFANASHILDVSNFHTTGEVIGTLTYHNNTIEPNFGGSIAVAPALGSDGTPYLLVAGEGIVTGATGNLKGVTKAIIRCKYKLDSIDTLLFKACVDCVIILVK